MIPSTDPRLHPNSLMRDLASLAIVFGGIAAVYSIYCNYHQVTLVKMQKKELQKKI